MIVDQGWLEQELEGLCGLGNEVRDYWERLNELKRPGNLGAEWILNVAETSWNLLSRIEHLKIVIQQ